MQAPNIRWNVSMKPSAKAGLDSVTSAGYWADTFVSARVILGPEGDARMLKALDDLCASPYKDRLQFLCEDVVDLEFPWKSLKGMIALLVQRINRDANQPGPSNTGQQGAEVSPPSQVSQLNGFVGIILTFLTAGVFLSGAFIGGTTCKPVSSQIG
jgi:hypothetical protein